MVIDKCRGKEYPQYLVYDVMMYDSKDVSRSSFFPDCLNIIEKEIIVGRMCAMKEGKLIREKEPFSVRLKEFWDLNLTSNFLSKKFSE